MGRRVRRREADSNRDSIQGVDSRLVPVVDSQVVLPVVDSQAVLRVVDSQVVLQARVVPVVDSSLVGEAGIQGAVVLGRLGGHSPVEAEGVVLGGVHWMVGAAGEPWRRAVAGEAGRAVRLGEEAEAGEACLPRRLGML